MSIAGAGGPPGPSARLQLARIAERVVATMPGVALTGLGNPAWQTTDRDGRIEGLTAVAEAEGKIELTLHLAVAWPPEPLPKLAEGLRRRVIAAVKREGLADHLGHVQLDIAAIEIDEFDGVVG